MKLPYLLALYFGVVGQACAGDLQIVNIQSAAGAKVGVPARGGLATLFVRGLDDVPKVSVSGPLPLPRELAGVKVMVRGLAAPLLAVINPGDVQQINLQIPSESNGFDCDQTENVSIVLEHAGRTVSASYNLTSRDAGEIFEIQGTGAFFHSDFSPITLEKPAALGETIVILATGLGPTSPAVPSGAPAPATEPLARFAPKQQCPGETVDEYSVQLINSGNEALRLEPQFIGLMPGYAGVFQINVKLPVDRPAYRPFTISLYRYRCGFFCQLRTGQYSSAPRNLPTTF